MNLLQQQHVNINYDFPFIVNLTLAQEIIRARKKMNISQQELASKLGISPRTLESWEKRCSPSIKFGTGFNQTIYKVTSICTG